MFKRAETAENAGQETGESGLSSSSSDSECSHTSKASSSSFGKAPWKVVVVGSRGIRFETRKLINELSMLLPHTKKESKFEGKRSGLAGLLEVCELANSQYCAYFTDNKDGDMFISAASTSGPTIKYGVQALLSSSNPRFEGNSARSTRPLLLFSPFFYKSEQGQIHRELLSKIFGAPLNHRKVKPFFDRIFYFCWQDGHIIFRNYEIPNDFSCREIGPSFALKPLLIQQGPFSGKVTWKATESNAPKAELLKKIASGAKFMRRKQNEQQRAEKKISFANSADPDFEDVMFG